MQVRALPNSRHRFCKESAQTIFNAIGEPQVRSLPLATALARSHSRPSVKRRGQRERRLDHLPNRAQLHGSIRSTCRHDKIIHLMHSKVTGWGVMHRGFARPAVEHHELLAHNMSL